MSSFKKLATILVISIFCLFVYFAFPLKDDSPGPVFPAENKGIPATAKLNNSTEAVNADRKNIPAVGLVEPVTDPMWINARNWLDGQSPKLTTGEEDLLLERTGRSSETLTGLIWLGSPRSALFVEELLKLHRSDDHAMASLVTARSSMGIDEKDFPKATALEIACALAEKSALPTQMSWHAFALAQIADKPEMAKYLREKAFLAGFTFSAVPFDDGAKQLLEMAGRSEDQVTMRMASQATSDSLPEFLFRDPSFMMRKKNWEEFSTEIREHIAVAESLQDDPRLLPGDKYRLLNTESSFANKWLEKYPDDTSLFGEPLVNTVSELKNELLAWSQYADAQSALPVLLETASDQDRAFFLQAIRNEGLTQALQAFKGRSPTVWHEVISKTSQIRTTGGLVPMAGYWVRGE